MAQPPPPPQRTPPEPTLYFAFGSNLSLAQMAARCPRSLYIGRAVLCDYRWQINTRGFANVFPCRGHSVEGLVYQIAPTDEASLDRSEGVAKACYSKGRCEVELYPASPELYRRPVAWIVDKGGPGAVLERAMRRSGTRKFTEIGPISDTRVLVYIDKLRTDKGVPREEYITRINTGIRDAVALGVDGKYFADVVRPLVPGEAALAPARERERAGMEEAERRRRGRSDRSASSPRETRERRVRGRRVTVVEYMLQSILPKRRQRTRRYSAT